MVAVISPTFHKPLTLYFLQVDKYKLLSQNKKQNKMKNTQSTPEVIYLNKLIKYLEHSPSKKNRRQVLKEISAIREKIKKNK